MKPFKIERDSWHFNLATRYGFLNKYDFSEEYPEDNPDFCKYVRSVFAGFALCTAIIAMCSILLGAFVLLPILSIIVYFEYGYLIDPELLWMTAVIIPSLIVASIFLNEEAIENRRKARYQKYLREKTEPPEPSFSQLLYKKFKEKTCFKIEVV
jgi:hypothetical protein